MNLAKRLIFFLLTLAALAGVGLGTYFLTGPSSPAQAASEDREQNNVKNESAGVSHGHGDEASTAAGKARKHNGHKDDGDAPDEEMDHEAGSPDSPLKGGGHAAHKHREPDAICPEHNVPEAEDALCNSERVPLMRAGEGMKVRLAFSGAAEKVGIATVLPLPADKAGATWPGQVVFNRNRLARLSSLSAGTVQRVMARLGGHVQKGTLLAEIAAPEAAGLKGELAAAESRRALAETVYLREKDLLSRGITSRHEFHQAEAEFREAQSAATRARQQARDYGLSGNGSTLQVRAPFAGTVVERTAVPGEAVAPGTHLFTLADLSTLWIEISAPEDALPEVQPGRGVMASFPGLPGRTFQGKIFWIAPALDERTRMLKALAEIDNREGVLRSGLFGDIRPAGRMAIGNLAVPAEALQSINGQPYVFVRLADDLFELRRVTPSRRTTGSVFIPEGVGPRDEIVSVQAFALKSEVLRARLGASCADH
ncbi:MAG: efflux RND transporter periplasmic adaptor subunit [Desulfobacteraceae bacterium]|nr:MAG: efflux RND transporter periplasmic adaptor subunit [Desulfobacteraceae bacterium]